MFKWFQWQNLPCTSLWTQGRICFCRWHWRQHHHQQYERRTAALQVAMHCSKQQIGKLLTTTRHLLNNIFVPPIIALCFCLRRVHSLSVTCLYSQLPSISVLMTNLFKKHCYFTCVTCVCVGVCVWTSVCAVHNVQCTMSVINLCHEQNQIGLKEKPSLMRTGQVWLVFGVVWTPTLPHFHVVTQAVLLITYHQPICELPQPTWQLPANYCHLWARCQ